MNCPLCTTELKVTTRMGVEIDACPRCRGVWLDRGELDKLVGLSERYQSMNHDADLYDDDSDDGSRGRRYPPPDPGHYHPPKKKSFWTQFFND